MWGVVIKKEKSCGCIVIDNDKVLLVKQNDGHTAFPKGHIEQGETEEECALRETFEETGLKVKIINGYRYTQTYFVKQDVLKEVVYFLFELKEGTLKKQDEEIKSLGFYSFEDSLSMISYKDTIALFYKVIQDIEKLKFDNKL